MDEAVSDLNNLASAQRLLLVAEDPRSVCRPVVRQ